ncbi:MAG: hypothetical protein ACT4PU_09315 [Planctomycetota bacterium]
MRTKLQGTQGHSGRRAVQHRLLSHLLRALPLLGALLLPATLAPGCAASASANAKSESGRLELHVFAPAGLDVRKAEVFLDGLSIGNAGPEMPTLHVRNGRHLLRVELPGCRAYEREVTILGAPNHQVVNVFLEAAGEGSSS